MHSFTRLTLTLITSVLCLTTLLAQSPWAPAPVPQGEYVPGEFIMHFPEEHLPNNADELVADFKDYHGLIVEAVGLDQGGSYFLIRLIQTTDEREPSGEFCNINAPEPLACKLCDVLSNPGGGGPMDRGDRFAPNYTGSSGLTYTYDPFAEYDLADIFAAEGYAPLIGQPSDDTAQENDFPEASNLENCYDEYTLPFSAGRSNRQIQVAILDSGIAPENYGDFFTYMENGEEQSIVDWSTIIPSDVLGNDYDQVETDPNGHGTAVSFLLAHDFVNQNIPEDIKLHSYRILDDQGRGTLAGLIWSLGHAINNDIHIVNMSFGFRATDCYRAGKEDARTILAPLFADAEEQNVLIFASAGNDNADLNEMPQWPAAYNEFSNIFTIGADGCTPGVKWEGSNYNADFVDLMAPGFMIALPYAGDLTDHTPGYYIFGSGTSFATPLAAGVAASYYARGGYFNALCALKASLHDSPDEAESNQVNMANSRFGSIFDVEEQRCLYVPDPGNNTEFRLNTGGDLGQAITAFPNPFNNQLSVQVDLSEGSSASVRILDSTGRPLASSKLTSDKATINTASFAPGVYFLQITDANGSRVERIVKQ